MCSKETVMRLRDEAVHDTIIPVEQGRAETLIVSVRPGKTEVSVLLKDGKPCWGATLILINVVPITTCCICQIYSRLLSLIAATGSAKQVRFPDAHRNKSSHIQMLSASLFLLTCCTVAIAQVDA